MEHYESILESADGLKLYTQAWYPSNESKAIVGLIHGYTEHSGRYQHVAEHFVQYGYGVEALDLRGYGQSAGKRAYVNSFDDYLDDAALFLGQVQERASGKPVFWVAHSMGGTICLLLAIEQQPKINGLLLSGAGIRIISQASRFIMALSPIGTRLTPRLPVYGMKSHLISRDPAIVEAYDNDPLVYHGGVLTRTGYELLQAAKRVEKNLETVTIPLLIMHGTADGLTDPKGSQLLYEKARSTDKTLKLYKGAYHEILNELDKTQTLADMVAWMDERV